MVYIKNMRVKDITMVAILTAILFVVEQVLSYVPVIQLTVFFLILFSKKIGMLRTYIIIIIHVLLDNLASGYFNILYVIFMILGYSFIPLFINVLFKDKEKIIELGLISIIFSFIYSWVLIIPGCIIFEMTFIEYLVGDISYEISLAVSSFLSIILLYKHLERVFNKV